jgi:hypothetical protein
MHTREPIELVEFLAPYPPHVQETALDARLMLLEQLYPANEIFYDAMSAVCIGLVYTEKVLDCFVNLAVYGDHVTLIFGDGAKLHDPANRLKGTGNKVRHIRIAGLETLGDPYVKGLIAQAALQAAKPQEETAPKVIVKVMNGPKRRPHAR